MNTDFDIGARLRELRTERSLSQEQLAFLANVTATYYGQVERNLKNVTVLKLEQICDVLEISLAEFFSTSLLQSNGDMDESTTKSIQVLIDRLSLSEKKAILQIMREVVSFRNLSKE